MITAGLDVGRTTDATVLMALRHLELVDALVIENKPFPEQFRLLGDRLRRHNPAAVAVDATGVGKAVADQLVVDGWPVIPYVIGSAGHLELFGLLRRTLHRPGFSVSRDCPHRARIRDELRQLGVGYTPRGQVHVAARSGHDDCCFALALALLAREHLRRGPHGPQAHPGPP